MSQIDPLKLDLLVFKDFLRMKKSKILIGVRKETTNKNDASVYVADYARVNEFGSFSKNIPARPFLRTAFDNYYKELERSFVAVFRNVLFGKTKKDNALGMLGLKMVAVVRKNIVNGDWKPNAPSVYKAKMRKGKGKSGSPKPLIDTSTMLNSITHKVEDK